MGHAAAPAAPAVLVHAPAESGPIVDMRVTHAKHRARRPGRGPARQRSARADLCGPRHARRPHRRARGVRAKSSCISPGTWSVTSGRSTARSSPMRHRSRFNHGERLRVTLVNDTMMTHPIHLHGMWSEVVDAQGQFRVRKHTVIVQPGAAPVLSRDRRCAGSLGLSLPPALSHGSRHVPRSGGGVRRTAFVDRRRSHARPWRRRRDRASSNTCRRIRRRLTCTKCRTAKWSR